MYDLVHKICLPQWIEYLQKKNLLVDQTQDKIPRKDALWKRVLRDIRDFYRILFRNRFYSYNYRNKHYQREWIRDFLLELNLPLPDTVLEYQFFFTFVHQTHRLKHDGRSMNRYDEMQQNPFWAIDCYNTKTRQTFLSHPISSRMIHFVVQNYSDIIEQWVNPKFRRAYMAWVANLKNFKMIKK